jgi:predicted O-methyltransferase YrrM
LPPRPARQRAPREGHPPERPSPESPARERPSRKPPRAGRIPRRPAQGPDYLAFLAHLHATRDPSWYLEIGTQKGSSLALSRARSIAIDPAFRLSGDVTRGKAALYLFQQTSDAFFASDAMARLGARIDMAFLDGMHLFDFLLRDFINTERHAAPGGVILMHDCVPWSAVMAGRTWDKAVTRSWTGDVWKLVPILRRHRPDLTVTVLDCAPTGLVMVGNLDPASTVLADRYDAILAEWMDVDLDSYGFARFLDEVALQPAAAFMQRPVPAVDGGLGFAIRIAARRARFAAGWGDFHFAASLAAALERLGHRAAVLAQDQWADAVADIDIVIRGLQAFAPVPGRPCLMWLISHPGSVTDAELLAMDHVFVASEPFARALSARLPGLPVSLLHQAFDPAVMRPYDTAPASGLLFVGMNRDGGRPAVLNALAAGYPVDLHGPGWQDDPRTAAFQRSQRVDNADLGRLYSGAQAVLCDYWDDMRASGFVSNRLFDVLASGAPPVSEAIDGIPADLAPWVHTFADAAGFRAAADAALSEGADRRAERRAFAAGMAERHSFDARAAVIVARAVALRDAARTEPAA